MTYKNIVKGLVDTYVESWFKQFITTKDAFCFVNSVDLEQEKDCIRFSCDLEVVGGKGIITRKYVVSGYVSELGAVVPCIIRTDMYEDDYYVWGSTKNVCDVYHITKDFTV